VSVFAELNNFIKKRSVRMRSREI